MNEEHQDFEKLLAARIDGDTDPARARRLTDLIHKDADLREEYIQQMAAHALLRWRSGEIPQNEPAGIIRPRFRNFIPLAAAAAVVLGLAAWWTLRSTGSPTSLVELEVIESLPTEGVGQISALVPGLKLAVGELRMPAGSFRFKLSSGAIVAATGPAHLSFITPMHLVVKQGKVTADVGKDAKGFIVETDQTRIVDLGTRFGVDASLSGHTDVVVFEGEIELKGNSTVGRMVEGEAVRIDSKKASSRITSITSGPGGDNEWSSDSAAAESSIIASIDDNIHNPQSNFYYRILRGGMREDAQAFIAKRHEWNGLDKKGLPEFLLGADLVQTFPTGSRTTDLQLIATLSRPAVVYVFVDSRLPAPDWLKRDFTDTGARIGLENAPLPESGLHVTSGPGEGNFAPFAVWKKEVTKPGTCVFGNPPGTESSGPNWMYGIAAKSL